MGKKGLLPSGYTQVEYISTETGAFINTGFVYKVAPRIVTECKHFYLNNNFDADFFGISTNTAPSWIGNFGHGGSWYRYGPTTAIVALLTFPNGPDTWASWDIGKEIYIDGTLVRTCSDYDFSTNTNVVYLFKGRNIAKCAYKIVKFYDGDTLVRHFIPCISPNNEVGMYDLISKSFFGNSSTGGSFVAGPVI